MSATTLSLMTGWSLEATLPRPAEIDSLAQRLSPGQEIFLSTLPHVSLDQQIETATLVRAGGLEPVLHVAARYFATRTELIGYLARACREANADKVLIIGGDLDKPRGPFGSALALIESGVLADYGIRHAGIAGYPEGHPKIADAELADALDRKLSALRAGGIEPEIVTQFCFSAAPIARWISETRARWPDVPIRVGLAGPARATTLVKFALRCGVIGSPGGFGQKLATAGKLVRTVSPEPVVVDLAACLPAGGAPVTIHLFSFGGLQRTADWVSETWPDALTATGQAVATRGRPAAP